MESMSPQSEPRKFMRLNDLMDMPLDVLYQVFHFLGVQHSSHLAANVPVIRSFLASDDAKVLWIRWLEAEAAPSCPAGFDMVRWAQLLLGEKVCENCGAMDALTNTRLLRNLCPACLSAPENIVVSQESELSSVASKISEMVPHDHDQSQGRSGTTNVYWKADWDATIAQLASFNRRVQQGEDISAERQAFVDSKVSIVRDIQVFADLWRQYTFAYQWKLSILARKDLKADLLGMGYTDDEITAICTQLPSINIYNGAVKEKLRPKILTIVETLRQEAQGWGI
ncbi:hypothetical protein ONZ45_g1936 [Pleurotus djamor]|nr:hypothetical protein ONZ45_g1936 [Pleurotus djamor]